jgi:hypothetical protein
LQDGVTVEHTITAREDAVDFRLVAHNPGSATQRGALGAAVRPAQRVHGIR